MPPDPHRAQRICSFNRKSKIKHPILKKVVYSLAGNISLVWLYVEKVKMEENVCYGPVSSKAQPAQAVVYEDTNPIPHQEVQIGGNVAYGHIRQ